MYLKSDRITITLDGLTFRTSTVKPTINPMTGKPDHSHVPEFQFILDPEAIEGWYDGTSIRRTGSERPNQWGDFADIGRKGSRVMTLTGSAITKSDGVAGIESLQKARDAFTGLLRSGGYQTMQVMTHSESVVAESSLTEGVESRETSVSLHGTPSWVRMSDNIAVWKIELYSPDPRIYGEPKKVLLLGYSSRGGLRYPIQYPIDFNNPATEPGATITNKGNVDSWPIYIVTGEYPAGFQITAGLHGGITYNGSVTFASPVTIDTGRGTAMQNGVDRSTDLSRRDWFPVPPNQTVRPAFDPIPIANAGILLGSCDIIFRDTWI